ncbi:MAG: hypothetical protein R2876_06450 [Eubacteriales bacterium]
MWKGIVGGCSAGMGNLMSIFSILSLIGGLAVFLYGMHLMGDALEKQSGSKFKHILEKLSSSP